MRLFPRPFLPPFPLLVVIRSRLRLTQQNTYRLLPSALRLALDFRSRHCGQRVANHNNAMLRHPQRPSLRLTRHAKPLRTNRRGRRPQLFQRHAIVHTARGARASSPSRGNHRIAVAMQCRQQLRIRIGRKMPLRTMGSPRAVDNGPRAGPAYPQRDGPHYLSYYSKTRPLYHQTCPDEAQSESCPAALHQSATKSSTRQPLFATPYDPPKPFFSSRSLAPLADPSLPSYPPSCPSWIPLHPSPLPLLTNLHRDRPRPVSPSWRQRHPPPRRPARDHHQ